MFELIDVIKLLILSVFIYNCLMVCPSIYRATEISNWEENKIYGHFLPLLNRLLVFILSFLIVMMMTIIISRIF